MNVNVSLLVDELRMKAGNPPQEEISDEVIMESVNEALNRVSNYVPVISIDKIETKSEQESYELDTEYLSVYQVYWSKTNINVFDSDFDLIVTNATTSSRLSDVELGVYERARRAMEKKLSEATTGWMFDESTKKLYLIPAPTETGKTVYFIALKKQSLSNLHETLLDPLKKLALAEILRAISRKRRRESGISHTGNLVPWQGADSLLSDAERLEQRATEILTAESKRLLSLLG